MEATLVSTLKELGKTISRSVVIGKIGAYGVDADDSKYYLVEWTDQPRLIEEDGVILVDGLMMQVFEGDWVCDGKWLNPVHRAKFWYTVGDVLVTVRLQSVLSTNLFMRGISDDNRLPRMGNGAAEAVLQMSPIKLLSQDHDLLMDEINRRQTLDHEEVIEDESDDESDDEHLDEESDDGEEVDESEDD